MTQTTTFTSDEAQCIRAARDWLRQPVFTHKELEHLTRHQLEAVVRMLRSDAESARVLLDLALEGH